MKMAIELSIVERTFSNLDNRNEIMATEGVLMAHHGMVEDIGDSVSVGITHV